MKETIVTEARHCPLRSFNENGQKCVLVKGLMCEEHLNSFPSKCPILRDSITIRSIYQERNIVQ